MTSAVPPASTAQPSPGDRVLVTVPATSANLGPGFDALGLALALVDEVTVEVAGPQDPPVTVHVAGEGADDLPRDASHLVVRALHLTCTRFGVQAPRVVLRATNRIPHGRGLGSSAAAAVAGVLAARALVAPGMSDDDVLALASEIEGHPDNAAACLLGGLTVAWSTDGEVRAVAVEPSTQVWAVVLVPQSRLATHVARGLLPATVPHADAAHAAGRAALLVAALTTSPELLLAATEDRLHQPYRAAAMPETARLVEELRALGMAAVVSGAGPSVLVLGGEGDTRPPAPPAGWRRMDVELAGTGARVATAPSP